MDRMVVLAERYIRGQEEANEGACFEAAEKAGYTMEEAEECDAGDKKCPTCPWKD